MKKIITFTITLFLICGCQTVTHIPAHEALTGLDFRPYADKNFHITPYVYTGKYTTIALINYVSMPEAKLITYKKGDGTTGKMWFQNEIDFETALDSIYEKCADMGADALMDFTFEEHSESYSKIMTPITIYGKKITGTAIRRED